MSDMNNLSHLIFFKLSIHFNVHNTLPSNQLLTILSKMNLKEEKSDEVSIMKTPPI